MVDARFVDARVIDLKGLHIALITWGLLKEKPRLVDGVFLIPMNARYELLITTTHGELWASSKKIR
jgi:hypothetical protein